MLIALHFRRSLSALAAPVLLLVGIFVSNQQLWEGMHLWINASNATAASITIIGPLASSVAALDAARSSIYRQRSYWDVSVVGPQRASVSILVASLLWNSAVYLGIALWTLLPAFMAHSWGSPVLPTLLAGLFGQWVAVSIGHLLGTLLPRRFIVIAAAPLTYSVIVLFLFLSSQINPRFLQLSFAPQNVQEVYYPLNDALLWMQATWLLLLGMLIAGLICLILRPSIKFGTVVVVALAGSLVAAGTIIDSPRSVSLIEASGVEFECIDGIGRLCFHPAYSGPGKTINESLDAARSRAEGTPFAIGTVWLTQRGPHSHSIPAGDRAIHVDELSQGWEELAIVQMYQESEADPTGVSICSAQGHSNNGENSFVFGLGAVIATWVAGYTFSGTLPDASADKLAGEFATTAEEMKADWINSHLKEICNI